MAWCPSGSRRSNEYATTLATAQVPALLTRARDFILLYSSHWVSWRSPPSPAEVEPSTLSHYLKNFTLSYVIHPDGRSPSFAEAGACSTSKGSEGAAFSPRALSTWLIINPAIENLPLNRQL